MHDTPITHIYVCYMHTYIYMWYIHVHKNTWVLTICSFPVQPCNSYHIADMRLSSCSKKVSELVWKLGTLVSGLCPPPPQCSRYHLVACLTWFVQSCCSYHKEPSAEGCRESCDGRCPFSCHCLLPVQEREWERQWLIFKQCLCWHIFGSELYIWKVVILGLNLMNKVVANLMTAIWGFSKTPRIVCLWTHFQKKRNNISRCQVVWQTSYLYGCIVIFNRTKHM